MITVVVCGSRSWTDGEIIEQRLTALPRSTTIIHGACPTGADALADDAARRLGFRVCPIPANWDRHGRSAGIVRNELMLDQKPALVIAFWDGKSPGTKHTIDAATRRGIPTEVIRPRGAE